MWHHQKRWRLCIEDATRSIWCHELIITDSTDRRPFECSNREIFLWCEELHWFGILSSTRWWSLSLEWIRRSSCLACCAVFAWGVCISSDQWSFTVGQDILHGRRPCMVFFFRLIFDFELWSFEFFGVVYNLDFGGVGIWNCFVNILLMIVSPLWPA